MADLVLPQYVAWPPTPIGTDRLIIGAPQPSDRPVLIALLTSPEAFRYLGGPRSTSDAEHFSEGPFGRTPGSFVVTRADTGDFVGTVGLNRRDADRPGHIQPAGLELEISYVLTPRQWGHGYATESVEAVLTWAATALPGDVVVVACTQAANTASVALLRRLGFTEGERFVEFEAQQCLWQRRPADLPDGTGAPREGFDSALRGYTSRVGRRRSKEEWAMKTLGLGVGVAIGYLAGNSEARRKATGAFRQLKATPPAKAIEDRVSSKVTQISSRMSTAEADDNQGPVSLGSNPDQAVSPSPSR